MSSSRGPRIIELVPYTAYQGLQKLVQHIDLNLAHQNLCSDYRPMQSIEREWVWFLVFRRKPIAIILEIIPRVIRVDQETRPIRQIGLAAVRVGSETKRFDICQLCGVSEDRATAGKCLEVAPFVLFITV